MFYKTSLVSHIAYVFVTLSIFVIYPFLNAQNFPVTDSLTLLPTSSAQAPSNLITNNPFVPKNSLPKNNAKQPTGPQSISTQSQILQKYLQFKSIAIINKKKYFSILNKRTNKSFWIPENETIENLRVTYYDKNNNTVSITDGINTEIIPIITANETPLNVVSAPLIENQDIKSPNIPGAEADQKKDKTPTRRRVIPVKRTKK